MRRLRARHWLAVTLAVTLIVVASTTETTDLESESAELSGVSPGDPPIERTADGDASGSGNSFGRAVGRIGDKSFTVPAAPGLTEEQRVAAATADETAGGASAGEDTAAGSTDDVGPALPVGPYTGLPVEPGTETRSALIMKIDNHPNARPQTGLDQADIVFDMRAEVVNRFAAVFQSTIPNPVGPVRSSRTSDFDILRGFDTPIYGSSGGNERVLAGLRPLPIVALTNYTRPEYYRDRTRSAPHNLYIDGNVLYDLAPDDLPVPEPWFQYRAAGEQLSSVSIPVKGPVAIDFSGSSEVTHEWDATVGGWLRTQDGEPHLTAAGEQLAPENVVIMITDYTTSAADAISPEVRSTGVGDLVVLTDGHAVLGTWERQTPEAKPTLLDRAGEIIRLTPGRTWVLLPEPDQVTLPDGREVTGGTATTGASNPSVSAQNRRCAAVADPGNCWPVTPTADVD
ncbi:MAG: DUF3048 domain-containing protein [Actinomycetota bacterium]